MLGESAVAEEAESLKGPSLFSAQPLFFYFFFLLAIATQARSEAFLSFF